MLAGFQAQAIDEFIAWQLAEAYRKPQADQDAASRADATSRTQINRLLDPNDGNVTVETLQRAAALVGRRVQLELV